VLLLLVSDFLICHFGAETGLSAMDTICTVLFLHLAEVFIYAEVSVLIQVLTLKFLLALEVDTAFMIKLQKILNSFIILL
jgi:hypothetical protein